uniref:Uncharacterized protein LOC104219761 n=1 Tax=Nicotiana sylvestris TaxID=4096 RepID=A0A1U7VQV1_NICSY|nr:PREDICTED: uncharacterized protein LOC104219761 [Nicotiana sylvestris]
MDEVNEFTREEGLHQAVIMKFSYGKPELQEFRKIFSSQFHVQGRCNIGLLEFRHLLIRFDLYSDYVLFLSRSTGYVKSKGDEFFFRTFPWTLGFNPKQETSMAVVCISFPGLAPNFFAKRSLMSIASAVGKAIAVDKTQEKTRPSAARVKVILDLLENRPKKVKLQIVDRISGKINVHYQEVVYDNLHKYCTFCKHQGHDDNVCRLMKEQAGKDVRSEVVNLPVMEANNIQKLQGDARDYLNAKRENQRYMEIAASKQVDEATQGTLVDQQVLQTDGGKQIFTLNSDQVMHRTTDSISVVDTSLIEKAGVEGLVNKNVVPNVTALAGNEMPSSEDSEMTKPIAAHATLPNDAIEQIVGQQMQSQSQDFQRSNSVSTVVAKDNGTGAECSILENFVALKTAGSVNAIWDRDVQLTKL